MREGGSEGRREKGRGGRVDVSAEWMSDLKEGFCPDAGYYSEEACCWFNNEVEPKTA